MEPANAGWDSLVKIALVSPALTTAASRENVKVDFVCARRVTWETSVLQVGAIIQASCIENRI